jgi:hypothetical protein
VKKSKPSLPFEDLSERERQNRVVQNLVFHYKQDQGRLAKMLYNCRDSVTGAERGEFERLFDWTNKAKPISISNYPRVFETINHVPGYKIDPLMMATLRGVIAGRQKVHKFFKGLPASDPRSDKMKDYSHLKMINTLKDGKKTLRGKST